MKKRFWRPTTRNVTAVVIGGGHNGLAMSVCLNRLGIDHVVLERAEVANSWRTERWDSLRLLTPNWQCQLPDHQYSGSNPDGFMPVAEVIEFIQQYATRHALPVHTNTNVLAVNPAGTGYRIRTDNGVWQCRVIVMANGNFSLPKVPALAKALPASITSMHARHYKRYEQLDQGGVLVVGASATGLQLASEISDSGRSVVLAVGEHVRMPRTYRGKDIQYWMHELRLLQEQYSTVDDIKRARRVPSPQLVGTPDRSTLDLNTLSAKGIKLMGRVAGLLDSTLQFSGSVANTCKLADLKMNRLLDRIDLRIEQEGIDAGSLAERFEETRVDTSVNLTMDLARGDIKTILWATGYKTDYSFLKMSILDRKGQLQHDGGICIDTPGLYLMGSTFMRHRQSSFISGSVDDASELSEHIATYLGHNSLAPAA